MAIMITDECINCGACEPECPNNAIYEGGAQWRWADGTSLKEVAAADGTVCPARRPKRRFRMSTTTSYRINAPSAWAFTKSRSAPPCAPSTAAWTTPTTAKPASACSRRKTGCTLPPNFPAFTSKKQPLLHRSGRLFACIQVVPACLKAICSGMALRCRS